MKRKYIKETKLISELERAITEAMDEVCTKHNFQIDYNLINIAFANVLRRNLYNELCDKLGDDE